MKNYQVRKMKPLDRFLYWISERHNIYKRRKRGRTAPWTDDKVLQENFFTNPYRENDKTSVWFRENIRDQLAGDPKVVFATICFRWFNLPSTGEVLIQNGLTCRWNERLALDILGRMREDGKKLFTGAFMIASPSKVPKYEAICKRLSQVWYYREWMMDEFSADCSLENFHDTLVQFDGLGGFMAYEIVCDLRYTYLLENAYDVDTWCNVGPGATRGLYRINRMDFDKSTNSVQLPHLDDELEQMEDLLETARYYLPRMPHMEMREIEHSLCEWDKYERCLWKEGKSKRSYKGTGE